MLTVGEILRPVHQRRSDYRSTSDQDYFIIELLRENIEKTLDVFATPAPVGGRSLDIGCGNQPFRHSLESLGYAYTGLDVQQNQKGNVDLIAAIDRPLTAELGEQAPFQLIFCTEVLEHVANWQQAFQNFASLLAPGGRLIVTCPFFWPLHEEPHDYWRPTVYAMKHFAETAGLSSLQLESAGTIWDVLGTLLGNCRVLPARPVLGARIITRLVEDLKRLLLRLLRSGWLQGKVKLSSTQGAISLSTIGVFQRN